MASTLCTGLFYCLNLVEFIVGSRYVSIHKFKLLCMVGIFKNIKGEKLKMKTKTDGMEKSKCDLAVRILKDDTTSFEVYKDDVERLSLLPTELSRVVDELRQFIKVDSICIVEDELYDGSWLEFEVTNEDNYFVGKENVKVPLEKKIRVELFKILVEKMPILDQYVKEKINHAMKNFKALIIEDKQTEKRNRYETISECDREYVEKILKEVIAVYSNTDTEGKFYLKKGFIGCHIGKELSVEIYW